MIYAILHVFQRYMAFVTADDETGFRDVFRNVVRECLCQVEERAGRLDSGMRARVETEIDALQPVPCDKLPGFTYDLGFEADGLAGKLAVDEVFFSEKDVIRRVQPWVDACNEELGLESEEERYAVFDGGFFSSTQGYEMDELFT